MTRVPSASSPRTRTGRSGSPDVQASASVSAMQVTSPVALAVASKAIGELTDARRILLDG